jgi:hypothetical protein
MTMAGELFDSLQRRDFLKATAGAAAATALPVGRVWAKPASTPAASTPESLAKLLYESLTPGQREAICFNWDHVDPRRGLLRTRVEPNWFITEPTVSNKFYTKDQKALVREIMKGIYSPEWLDRVDAQMDEDSGGWEESTIALFGRPDEKFEFVMTGRHLTVRCDGNTSEHVAFGGPIFYGHAAEDFNEAPDHPGNVYWSQGVAANGLYQMLDGEQQQAALVRRGLPKQSRVGFGDARPQGIPVAQLSADQQEHLQQVLRKLVEPYRQVDRQEVHDCLSAQGGLQACRLAYFAQEDIGGDGVWDNWRLEGPAFVWHYRGAPHVHVWVNVADDPDVRLNSWA